MNNSVSFDNNRIFTEDVSVLKVMDFLNIENGKYCETLELSSSDILFFRVTILEAKSVEEAIQELDDCQAVDATVIAGRDDISIVEDTLMGTTSSFRSFSVVITEGLQKKFDEFNVKFVNNSYVGDLHSALEGERAYTFSWFKTSETFRQSIRFLNQRTEALFQQDAYISYAEDMLYLHYTYQKYLRDVKRLRKALRIMRRYQGTRLYQKLKNI